MVADRARSGLPVFLAKDGYPGFIITTQDHRNYMAHGSFPMLVTML